MKILVFSDTHGDVSEMSHIVSVNRYDTDLIIHLGDHLKDLQTVMLDYPMIASLGVLGNCDFASTYNGAKFEGTFTVDKRKIFYTHGHKYNVKYGHEYIVSNAKFNGADIVLYGHSHVSLCQEHGGVLVINPGSLSCPRDGSRGTYAVLEIKGSSVKCDIKEI